MKVLALSAYFPVFGWFFPMFFGKAGSPARYHARQGFMAFVFFSLCSAFAWLASYSVPTFIAFVEHLLYAIALGGYVCLLVYGGVAALQRKERPLPLIGKKAESLPL